MTNPYEPMDYYAIILMTCSTDSVIKIIVYESTERLRDFGEII